MFDMNNKKKKSSVILNPERSEWVSRSHVTSVEPVVNDGVKTKGYSAKRDLYGDFAYAQPLKMTALAFLLSLNLSTAFAGTTCNWDGTKLIIGGSGTFNVCFNHSQKNATEVTIGTGVTSIGDWAFWNASSLTSITIPDSVTSIGWYAFVGASSLTSITIPEGVTSIGERAFSGATGLKSIIIPDDIYTENWAANVFQNLPANTDIVCQGDLNTCYEKLAKYIPKNKGGDCTNSDLCINKEIQPALFDSCKSTNYFWDGSTCIREPDVTKRKCCTSCKDMGGFCNRIRYTPAEAAKVLTDDNNNSVTITFKK